MGAFDDVKPKTADETLKEAIEALDECRFRFVIFFDSFKRYLKKAGLLDDSETG